MNDIMNDITTKQKLAVAKLLPERIYIELYQPLDNKLTPINIFYLKESNGELKSIVRYTEWLQIIQWVEEGLTGEQPTEYAQALWDLVIDSQPPDMKDKFFNMLHASVEQRLAALEAAGIINTTKE